MTISPKVSFGIAKYSPVKNVGYVSWEDAFDVEFDDGLSFLEPHAIVKITDDVRR
jgi:hypothetical protein